nr:MAG TPA: hypothetical protein [Ackermannviridae sp.]
MVTRLKIKENFEKGLRIISQTFCVNECKDYLLLSSDWI